MLKTKTMALTKIKSSFSKFKASSVRTKTLVAVFVIGFAGLGVFQIVNSGAAATASGTVSIVVNEVNVQGVFTGNKVTNASITVNANPYSASYYCFQSNTTYPVGTGSSNTTGAGFFTCTTYLGTTGKQYTANATKNGYTSAGPATFTVEANTQKVVNLTLRQLDGDNDGVADINDQCPTQGGAVLANGCPAPAETNASISTFKAASSSVVKGQTASLTFASTGASNCGVLTYEQSTGAFISNTVTSGTNGTFVTPSLSSSKYYFLQCSGTGGGLPQISAPIKITVT